MRDEMRLKPWRRQGLTGLPKDLWQRASNDFSVTLPAVDQAA